MSIIQIDTDYPIAVDSNDHLYPWGTSRDNSSSNSFITDVKNHFNNKKINFLDLGCSGGKLVKDFIPHCTWSVGLEGSDYSIRNERAEWPELYGRNLFTCDISQPFKIWEDNVNARLISHGEEGVKWEETTIGVISPPTLKFNCITAWEVVEHIKTDRLEIFFENIYNHLSDDGIFCCSVSTMIEPAYGGPPDVFLHQTVWDEPTWDRYFDTRTRLARTPTLLISSRVRLENGSFQRDFHKMNIIEKKTKIYQVKSRLEFPKLIDDNDFKIAAEVGVRAGKYSKHLLKNSNLRILYSIDPFSPEYPEYNMDEKTATENLKQFGERSKIVKKASWDCENDFFDNFFDFVYIDGAHDYESVKKDISLFYRKIKNGGILAGHDYSNDQMGVKSAVDEFCQLNKLKLFIAPYSGIRNDDAGEEATQPSFYFMKSFYFGFRGLNNV